MLVKAGLIFSWLIICSGFHVNSADIYVDNLKGNDNNSGSKEQPIRTFKKCLTVLKGGDTLHLVPNSEPYREEFGMLTKKYSGTPEKPTVIDGHGAFLTRMNHLPGSMWKNEGNDIFSLKFRNNVICMFHKGYYDGFPFVFADGKPLQCVKSIDKLVPNSSCLILKLDMSMPPPRKRHKDCDKLYIKLESGKTPHDVKIMAPGVRDIRVRGDYITVKNIKASWSASDLFDSERGKGIIFEGLDVSNCMDQCISAHSTAGAIVRRSIFRNALAMCALDITYRLTDDCRMKYIGCIFEQGGAGFQGGGHYLVENCIIRDNMPIALMARQNAELKVKNCILVKGENGVNGLHVSGNAKVEMENCTFVGFTNGICVIGKNATVKLKNCVFINCKSVYTFRNGSSPDKQLVSENNLFSGPVSFTVNNRPLIGLAAFRKKYPEHESGSRELGPGEKVVGGSSINPVFTLKELNSYLDGK